MRRWKAWVEREIAHVVSEDDARRRAACQALSELRVRGPGAPARRQLDAAFARVCHAMRTSESSGVRRDAAYVLLHWPQKRALGALVAVVADAKEDPLVRGQAAEGVGWHLQFVKHPESRERAIAALRSGLADAAPAVRFWSAYALGMGKAEEARAELEKLARSGDPAVWQNGWWTVGEEAQDAVEVLDGRPWPDRIPATAIGEQDSGY